MVKSTNKTLPNKTKSRMMLESFSSWIDLKSRRIAVEAVDSHPEFDLEESD
jgi:hypothetical protein